MVDSAMMGSVEKLGEYDRVQKDIRRHDLEESLDQPRVVLPQVGDPGVRVQEVNHGISSRCSYSNGSGRFRSPCQAPAVSMTN